MFKKNINREYMVTVTATKTYYITSHDIEVAEDEALEEAAIELSAADDIEIHEVEIA